MTSVKIVNVDYYLSYPVKDLDICYSEYRGVEVRQVPVLQIFGSTREGTKTCLHVHGVLPYVYIPYDGAEPAAGMAYKLAADIDKALNISLGQSSANSCFVHNIVLVSGRPLYGYHEKEHQYFKIFFYNPMIVKRACSLLENGAVLGKHFQPHESHINYVLQFMIDYNLQGMNYVNLAQVKYRFDPGQPELLAQVPSVQILPRSVQKRSFCKLEVDALASDISNIEEILSGRLAVNPGLAAIWEDERQRRRNQQLGSELSFCLTQERAGEPKPTATHRLFQQKLLEKLANASLGDDTSIDPNRSVYPAESPSDAELLNASVVLSNVLTTPSADRTVTESSLIENASLDRIDRNMLALLEGLKDSTDVANGSPCETSAGEGIEEDSGLLKMLQELKAAADVEEDSILSQTVHDVASDQSSGDEDEPNLSLPLPEAGEHDANLEATDDLVWEDSFWDEHCQIPQLDGVYDSNEPDSVSLYDRQEIEPACQFTEHSSTRTDDQLACQFADHFSTQTDDQSARQFENHSSTQTDDQPACQFTNHSSIRTADQNRDVRNRNFSSCSRYANEVYLAQNADGTLGPDQLLTRGLNVLRPGARAGNSRHKAHILSNIANPDLKISISVSTYDWTRCEITVLQGRDVAIGACLVPDENNLEDKLMCDRPANPDQESLLGNDIATELSNSGYCDFATLDSVLKSAPKHSSLSVNETGNNQRSQEENISSESCLDSVVSSAPDRSASPCTQLAAICKRDKVSAVPSLPVLAFRQWLQVMEQRSSDDEQQAVAVWVPLLVDGHVLDTGWAMDESSVHGFTLPDRTDAGEKCHVSAIAGEPGIVQEQSTEWRAIPKRQTFEQSVSDSVACHEIIGASVVPCFTIEGPRAFSLPGQVIAVNAEEVSEDKWRAAETEASEDKLRATETEVSDHKTVVDSDSAGFSPSERVRAPWNPMDCMPFMEVEVNTETQENCDESVLESDPFKALEANPDEKVRNTMEPGDSSETDSVAGNEEDGNSRETGESADSPKSVADPIEVNSVQNSDGLENKEKVHETVCSVIEISSDSADSAYPPLDEDSRTCTTNGPQEPQDSVAPEPGNSSVKYGSNTNETNTPVDLSPIMVAARKESQEVALVNRMPGEARTTQAANEVANGVLSLVETIQGDEMSGEKVTVTKTELAGLIEKVLALHFKTKAGETERVLPKEDEMVVSRPSVNTNQESKPQGRPKRKRRVLAIKNLRERQLVNVPKLLRHLAKLPIGTKRLKKIQAMLAKVVQKRARKRRPVKKLPRKRVPEVTSSDNSTKSSETEGETNAELERTSQKSCSAMENSHADNHNSSNYPGAENAARHNNDNATTLATNANRPSLVANVSSVTPPEQGEPKSTVTQPHGIRDVGVDTPMSEADDERIRAMACRVRAALQSTLRLNPRWGLPQTDFRGCFRTGIPGRDLCAATSSAPNYNMPFSPKWYVPRHPLVPVGQRMAQLPIRPEGQSYRMLVNRSNTAHDDHAVQSVVVSDDDAASIGDGILTQAEDPYEAQQIEEDSEKNKNVKPAVDSAVKPGAGKSTPKANPRRSTRLFSQPTEIETKPASSNTKQGGSTGIKDKLQVVQNCDTTDEDVALVPKINQDEAKKSDGTVQKYRKRQQTSATVTAKDKKVLDSKLNANIPSRNESSVKTAAKGKAAGASSSGLTKMVHKVTKPSPGPSRGFTYKRKLRSSGGKGDQKPSKLVNTPPLTLESSSSEETLLTIPPKRLKQQTLANKSAVKKDSAPVKKPANKPAAKETAVKKNRIVDKATKKSEKGAQKTEEKNRYWNLDGQGDSSDSSQFSDSDCKEQQQAGRLKKRTARGPSPGNMPRRESRRSSGATKRLTRSKTRHRSANLVEQKLLRTEPEAAHQVTNQLRVHLVPLNLQELKYGEDPPKEHLSGQTGKIQKPADKGIPSTVAGEPMEQSDWAIEHLDFAKLNLESEEVARERVASKSAEDKTDVKTQPNGSNLMQKKGRATATKIVKIELMRENLAVKKRQLFPSPAIDTVKLNKRSYRSCRDKTPTKSGQHLRTAAKFSPLNVVIQSPKPKRVKVNDPMDVASELQIAPTGFGVAGTQNSAQQHSSQSDEMPAPTTAASGQIPMRGIGELQVNGIIPITQNVTTPEIIATSLNSKPTCDITYQTIPSDLSKPSSISKSLTETTHRDKSPSSVKKKLFSSAIPQLTTIVEEHRVCSYKKSTRKPSKPVPINAHSNISKMAQEEENFLNEIDQIYEQYGISSDFNKKTEDVDLPPAKSVHNGIKPQAECLTHSEQASHLTLNQINRPGSSPIFLNDSPIQKTDLNSPFVQRDFTTPDKKLFPPPILTTSPETLAHQSLQERSSVAHYYTRIARLSAAEMYDLERGFTPEPSTSKATAAYVSRRTRSSAAQTKDHDFGSNTPQYPASQSSNVTNYKSGSIDWSECGAKIGDAWNKLYAPGAGNQAALTTSPTTSKQSYEKDFSAGKASLAAMGVYEPFGFESDCEMNDYDSVPAVVLSTTTDDNEPNAETSVSAETSDHNDGSKRKPQGSFMDNSGASTNSDSVRCTDQQREPIVATPANHNSGDLQPAFENVSKVKQLEKSLAAFRDMLFDSKNLITETDLAEVQDDKPVDFTCSEGRTDGPVMDTFDDDDTIIENTPPSAQPSSRLIPRNVSQVREPSVVDFFGDDSKISNISGQNMTPTQNSGETQAEQLSISAVPENVIGQINTEPAENIQHNSYLNVSQIGKPSSDPSKNDAALQDDTAIESVPVKLEFLTPKLNTSAPVSVPQASDLPKTNIIVPKYYPPTYEDIQNSLAEYNIPECRYQQPFYSDYADVTKRMDVGHNVLKIPSNTVLDLEEFQCSTEFIGLDAWRRQKYQKLHPSQDIGKINFHVTMAGDSQVILTPGVQPPTAQAVADWLKAKEQAANAKLSPKRQKKVEIYVPMTPSGNLDDSMSETMTLTPCTPDLPTPATSQSTPDASETTPKLSQPQRQSRAKENLQRKVLFSQSSAKPPGPESGDICPKPLNASDASVHNNSHQITGVTLENTHDFKVDYENLQHAKAVSEPLNLTVMVVELHIRTRADFCPDPQYDSVRAIFYSILNDVPVSCDSLPREETGILVVEEKAGGDRLLEGTGIRCDIVYTRSEPDLMSEFVRLVRKWDPDIFAGYEIEMHSWGYLVERCNTLGINLSAQISRINPAVVRTRPPGGDGEPSRELQLTGRIVLDMWRLLRHEVALQSYTFENTMYHILHERQPKHTYRDLSFWWDYRANNYRRITARYYLVRVHGVLRLLDQLDLLGRTAELAKLFGIQFFEVLSRGSQFRVESMMLRLAKPLNYIPVSPSVTQRARMRAPEFVPLIFEPESRFYTDPVIVLDFQSLYPSIIIAYNYCFSTCLGRVEHLGSEQPFEFGASQLRVPRATLHKLAHTVNWSPCGVGFVGPTVRQGVLPRMLQEILETRLMVKHSMKAHRQDKLLQRVLHSRQLGLKLIANVTYGYTAANFSGRMPCIEVGDSVVSKGRETLERAIRLIERTQEWRARVVYGDTDSLFVLVAGRSKAEAFRIGAEIAAAVTDDNPTPVKLKLEKVFLPCILQTKKRYVGYMYETADQAEPEYLAKGIETVRRDGCPAVAKMLEKCLRILFETRDVSLVKRYACRQFTKLLGGRASVQDLTFAREYRGASGYRPGACVPALELARRWRRTDKRREPRAGERVPYVIVNGPPGLPLIRLVRCPRELLADPSRLRPNAVYYISRVLVPALNRCFALIGADMQAWFNEMPRKQLQVLPADGHHTDNTRKSTISQYFATMSCAACGQQTRDGLCAACRTQPQATLVVLHDKLNTWERTYADVHRICQSCCARVEYLDCNSLDCPVMYRLNQVRRDLRQVPFVRGLLRKMDS